MQTVKFVWKTALESGEETFRRQLPPELEASTDLRFSFDPTLAEYDWLVVYDDLPRPHQARTAFPNHRLNCPPDQALLVTVEPSSIKTYGTDYLNQFGIVLTSQETWAIDLPNVVRSQPALRWYYGASSEGNRTWQDIQANPPHPKTQILSTVCSSKRQKKTNHAARYDFTMLLRDRLPDLTLFGRGIRPIKDKADALDAFRYHIAVENHVAPHHWTEKLADTFLGGCLPFYHGCPNVCDYFPADSIVPINIHRPEEALDIIRAEIAENGYEKRLPAIMEARRRVLEEYNLFAVVSKLIRSHDFTTGSSETGLIYSRHEMRRKNLGCLLRFGVEHHTTRWRHARYKGRAA